MEKMTEIISTADTFQIEDDVFDNIIQEIQVSDKNKRFSIENQLDDMLDDLLSHVSTSERNKTVINEINKNIVRFKELRKDYSMFKKDGTIENIRYTMVEMNILHLDLYYH